MPLIVAIIVGLLGFFTIRYFALLKNSEVLHFLSIVFIFGALITEELYSIQTAFIHPFHLEKITQGIISGEGNLKGSHHFTKYVYYVNDQEYEGGFGRYNKYCELYELGDTIDVTYNEENPEESIATYQQYWYINKDKEIYWLKVKHGEGRRSRY